MPIYFKPVAAQIQIKEKSFLKLDPYLISYIDSEKFRSQTHRGGDKKPRWDSYYSFYFRKIQEIMRIQVWDQNIFDDQLIGEGNVNLKKILKNPKTKTQFSIPLYLHGRRTGKVIFFLEYQGLPIQFPQDLQRNANFLTYGYGQKTMGMQQKQQNRVTLGYLNWNNIGKNINQTQKLQYGQSPFLRTANNQTKVLTPIHNLQRTFYSPSHQSMKVNWNYLTPRATRNFQTTL